MKKWTESEINRLVWLWDEYMGKAGANVLIAEQMNRSWDSCYCMAKKIGLRRLANGKSTFSVKQIAEIFDTVPQNVSNWIYDGAFPGAEPHTCRTPHAIGFDSVVEFLDNKMYWHMWEPSRISVRRIQELAERTRAGWLSRSEAAKLLGISPSYLSTLRDRGEVVGHIQENVTWYERKDIEELGAKKGWLHG